MGGPVETVNAQAPLQFARDFTRAADERQLGWLWFAYSSIDEAYGINFGGELDVPLIRELARPFPRAVAGALETFSFDPETKVYRQQWRENPGGLHEIALPMRWQYPDGACLQVDGAAAGAIDAAGQVAAADFSFDTLRQTLRYAGRGLLLEIRPGSCD